MPLAHGSQPRAARPAVPDPLARLARLRVPLGFVFGLVVLWLAHPTWPLLAAGGAVACVGEAIRVWAAGHLEKSREVTKSGPYRFSRHPLYVGSSVMGVGIAIASATWVVALLVAVYLAGTLTAAIRTEERFLRRAFGGEYDAYSAGRATDVARRFSVARAVANREYRAVGGLAAGLALLALKAAFRV